MIIDAWMHHFDESQLTHPMFASLRRWTRQSFAPVTPDMTIVAMGEGSGCRWACGRVVRT